MSEQQIDVSQFETLFPNMGKRNYGWVYKLDIPDEVYKTHTYIRSAPQMSRQIHVVQNESSIVRTNNTKVRKSQPAASPFDFRLTLDPQPMWEMISSVDTSSLEFSVFKSKIEEEDIKFVGTPSVIPSSIINIKPSKCKEMPTVERIYPENIMEDPEILSIISKPTTHKLRIIATARTLAAISSCNRSVCPFDISFKKVGNDLYVLPCEPYSTSVGETINETSMVTEVVRRDDMAAEFLKNIPESTLAAEEFRQLIQSESSVENAQKSVLYRRIVFNDLEFIIRCDVDALHTPVTNNDRPDIAVCRTFCAVPTVIKPCNWNTRLEKEIEKSKVLTEEIKDNGALYAKWLAITRLTNASSMVIGYARRKVSNTDSKHVLVGVSRQSFATGSKNVNFSDQYIFSVLNTVFSSFFSQENGVYTFIRDPKRRNYRIYKQ